MPRQRHRMDIQNQRNTATVSRPRTPAAAEWEEAAQGQEVCDPCHPPGGQVLLNDHSRLLPGLLASFAKRRI